jgi:sulfate adenylyltransferase
MNQGTDVSLVAPFGGKLVNLIVDAAERADLINYANRLPSIRISERTACDLQLLACGAFSPLDRFVSENDYQRIVAEMRLTSGHLFPIPVTLPVNPQPEISLDRDVALRNAKNQLLAIQTIEEIFHWDFAAETRAVLGTSDPRHPLVTEMKSWGELCISGSLRVLDIPRPYDFRELRMTPAEVRARLETLGHSNVVAFQTRNPLHRAHEEMTKRAIDAVDGVLLLHPVVGLTKPGDIDHYTRVRTYKILADRYYPHDRILLSLLPLAMRLAGPREALWHALIRRNFGANYFIIGRDHGTPGNDSMNRPFYEPYAAQELVSEFSHELEVNVIPFQELVYSPETDSYVEADTENTTRLSGTKMRTDYLEPGRELPSWFARPEIAKILATAVPSRHQQGVCIWFTGLSAAGKSTTAEILTALLLEAGRRVTLLDGDVVRTNLSDGLGFSKSDRDTNIRRIGFVAREIVRHGGIAVCAAISPYRDARNEVRKLFWPDHFIEVFVNTPLKVCEQRDAKGIYCRARAGELSNVTGIDDPYEEPVNPEFTLDTIDVSAEANARTILDHLIAKGFVHSTDAPLKN